MREEGETDNHERGGEKRKTRRDTVGMKERTRGYHKKLRHKIILSELYPTAEVELHTNILL